MKLKLIWISLFTLSIILGSVFYFQNIELKPIGAPSRNYIVVQIRGPVKYKEPLTFSSGETILNIITKFIVTNEADINNIYLKVGKEWEKVELNRRLDNDSILKITEK